MRGTLVHKESLTSNALHLVPQVPTHQGTHFGAHKTGGKEDLGVGICSGGGTVTWAGVQTSMAAASTGTGAAPRDSLGIGSGFEVP